MRHIPRSVVEKDADLMPHRRELDKHHIKMKLIYSDVGSCCLEHKLYTRGSGTAHNGNEENELQGVVDHVQYAHQQCQI